MQDILQVSIRFVADEFGRFNQTVNYARRLGSFFISMKQPGLSPHNKRPYGILSCVIVGSNLAVLQKANKSIPLVEAVLNSLCCFTRRQYLIAHRLKPLFETCQKFFH